ncbi:hypothetical protein [Streptomyces sp. NPDC006309]|uniref:hypothetical protein n=1 Tax=Streptomyces sp. NPDC006309 TaxID=3156749 RepID=UPI0033A69C2B
MGEPAGLDLAMAPARRKTGEILADCTSEQLTTLFDYFTRATQAYRAAADELRDTGPGR